MTPTEIHSPNMTSLSPTHRYGSSGTSPPKKYASAMVSADVSALDDPGSSAQCSKRVMKSTISSVPEAERWCVNSETTWCGTEYGAKTRVMLRSAAAGSSSRRVAVCNLVS